MPRKLGLFWLVARDQRLEGTAQLAAVVRRQRGPTAKPALIQQHRGAPVTCRAGMAIATAFNLGKPVRNLGVQILHRSRNALPRVAMA